MTLDDRFQAWAVDRGYDRSPMLPEMFEAWQAAVAATVEEAVRICDEQAEGRCDSHESAAIDNCAEAIQELAPPEGAKP